MKRLRLLGLMLMAVFALGAVASATASATEVGILTLTALEKLEVKQETKNEALANKGILKSVGGNIECTKVWVLPGKVIRVDGKHWTLIEDLDIHFSGCKFGGALACSTEGDAKEVILTLVDVHFVAFKVGAGPLIPGAIFVVLNAKLEPKPLTILCGGVSIEVTGVATAKAVQLTEALKEETGEAETKPFTIKAEPGLKCDDPLCEKLLPEKEPLLANTGEGFKGATEETEAVPMTFSADVLWDK